ncbi:recombinase family protein [Desulfosarcina cetonica]|uniref:recombinase family protein n=1 Tax=Desulfosarcina cetonica TaxID=90730 RepID=UPI001FEDAD9E|nr:recombinase family protein [Desulfosarcina cetonica]
MNRTSIQSLSSARQPVPEENGATRCAIYTRKSTDEGLEQEFNSLDAQRESAEAYIVSQRHEGWSCLPARYDDGGFTGGNMERPAFNACSPISRPGRSTASWSTRWIGSVVPSWISPA